MKRIVTAILLLTSSFLICFYGYFSVEKECEKLENILKAIVYETQAENVSQTKKLSSEAVALWEEVHGKIESFIRHEETDRLEEIIKSLPVYARQGNMERLEQQADSGIDEISHLIRSEKPIISNIF